MVFEDPKLTLYIHYKYDQKFHTAVEMLMPIKSIIKMYLEDELDKFSKDIKVYGRKYTMSYGSYDSDLYGQTLHHIYAKSIDYDQEGPVEGLRAIVEFYISSEPRVDNWSSKRIEL